MASKQEEFFRELLADFRLEADEHRNTITNSLLELEKRPEGEAHKQLVEVMFRAAHSLKGAARAVNLADIERLCQAMEGVMSQLRQGILMLSSELFDIMHQAINLLSQMLAGIESPIPSYSSGQLQQMQVSLSTLQLGGHKSTYSQFESATQLPQIEPIKADLPSLNLDTSKPDNSQESSASIPIPQVQAPAVELPKESQAATFASNEVLPRETVRINTDKLSVLLLQAEELITAKAMLRNSSDEIKNLMRDYLSQAKGIESLIHAGIGQGGDDSLLSELHSRNKENSKRTRQNISTLYKKSEQLHRSVSRMVDDLLLDIRKTLLVPFASITAIFPKLVRDLSKELHKELIFNIEGGDIEIDRRILEALKDPLIHLLRNCVDHGIETVEQRVNSGKKPMGTLLLRIAQTNDRRVTITITDDGAGINVDKVALSAIREGLVSAEAVQEMSEHDKLQLILLSGVSTSNYITNISGRGLGMAIVAEKVNGLGGSVEISSGLGLGTTTIISVPLTLATFRGVIVSASANLFMVPINTIERVIRIKHTDIREVKNQETIVVDGRPVGLVRLADALGLTSKYQTSRKNSYYQALILAVGQRRMAYLTDEIVGEQEGIVKSLGSQLQYVRNILGAIVLGDGKVVPVLNVQELMDTSKGVKSSMLTDNELLSEEHEVDAHLRILVAEDSLTSRSLLRNILEAEGYQVKTAVDGAEAFACLSNERFDLLVSDIEMPRMNGFELTQKVRADDKLSSLPVVLITSLDSAEDRQRGLEAGANAYFVKSSFDQTDMIEIIQRLI